MKVKNLTISSFEVMITDKHVPGICKQRTAFAFRLRLYQYTTDSISLSAGSKLRRLNLDHCNMGDPKAFALANNSSLFKLSLAGCNLYNEGTVALFKNSYIKKLNLNGNNLTDKCLESFSTDNHTLLGLNLRRNMLTDVGAQSLAQSSSLKAVYLYANRIGYTGIEKLIKSSITKIELGGYRISPEETRRMQALLYNEKFKDKKVVFH